MTEISCVLGKVNMSNPYDAIELINVLKEGGYIVEWICDNPEDNEIIWKNTL